MRISTWLISGALLVLALPAAAFGQVTRTWVSGVGDDANPCSRTAPCKTFAGAISKTAAAGEIDVLDSGGFGAVTITKALTISATGLTAGVLVAGTNGIVVQAGVGDAVTLRGLDIDGLGPGPNQGLSGIKVLSAASVRVENSSIFGFATAGIDFEPSNANGKLFVTNTSIHDNSGDGVLAAPPAGGSGSVALSQSYVDNNACGLVATSLGPTSNFAVNCGTNGPGTSAGSIQMSSAHTTINGNSGAGVLSNGPSAGNVITGDTITGNGVGLQAINGGSILWLDDNEVFGNTADGNATAVKNQRVGPAGATGPAGPAGSVGATGQQGAAGQVELITCKTITTTVKKHGKKRKVSQQQCTGKLVSGPVKFTTGGSSAVRATLSRAALSYATGSARLGRSGAQVLLTLRRRLVAGRYTLTLARSARTLRRYTVFVS